MEYNVGDSVCVLPYKQIEAMFESRREGGGGYMPDSIFFNPAMKVYCGRTFVISSRITNRRYKLQGVDHWVFHPDWFVEVTPPEDMTVTVSFEDMLDAMHD